ncbi:MAG: hypothetical protein GQ523_08130 [Methanophagales archaeon]|nr:hypothetical protein [Methanophagales archaeon]
MNKIRLLAQKPDESPRIVLTADETMMSKYRWGIFVGFSTCMPKGIIPDWFFLVCGHRQGRRRAIELCMRMQDSGLWKLV